MAKASTQGVVGRIMGRKLSVKDMGFDKPAIQALVIADQNVSHFLARFVGIVTGVRPYKIKEGERIGEIGYGLQGQFEGSTADGEVKDGAVLYLPAYVNDSIVTIFQSDETVASVNIAFDVYATYDADSATSYTFTVSDLLNTGSNSVEEVKTQIQALPMPPATLALPAS